MSLSSETIDGIADYVRRGVPLRTAGEAHGLSGDHVVELVEEGESATRGWKRTLTEKVRKARAEFLASQTMIITKAAVGFRRQDTGHEEADWRAAELALTRAAEEEHLAKLRRLTT